MNSLKIIPISVLTTVLTVFLIFHFVDSPYLENQEPQETVFERVLRTNTLRCGYWQWPPLTSKDPVTGEMSGIFYEYVNELGNILNLDIEWVKDTGFTDYVLDLEFERIDAQCAGVWPIAPRPRAMDFTEPIFYIPLNIYVRADDHRFDYKDDLLNNPHVTFASMDGLVGDIVIDQKYPEAEKLILTETNTVPELFLNIVNGKADATVNDVFTAYNYMTSNPDKLKKLPLDYPVLFFGNTIAVKKGEDELTRMLDQATRQLHYNGYIENLIQKYENTPGALLRVSSPIDLRRSPYKN